MQSVIPAAAGRKRIRKGSVHVRSSIAHDQGAWGRQGVCPPWVPARPARRLALRGLGSRPGLGVPAAQARMSGRAAEQSAGTNRPRFAPKTLAPRMRTSSSRRMHIHTSGPGAPGGPCTPLSPLGPGAPSSPRGPDTPCQKRKSIQIGIRIFKFNEIKLEDKHNVWTRANSCPLAGAVENWFTSGPGAPGAPDIPAGPCEPGGPCQRDVRMLLLYISM